MIGTVNASADLEDPPQESICLADVIFLHEGIGEPYTCIY